jgi:LPS-assembly protein
MPHRRTTIVSTRVATFGIVALTLATPSIANGQTFTGRAAAPRVAGSDRTDKNVILTADNVMRDTINNTVSANGNVEFVQGPSMLLAEHVIYNQTTDIVIATGNVKLVSDQGDIYFGDYLELSDDMRKGFIDNVSALLSDNSRLVGRHADKDGNIVTIERAIYSPCMLCTDDPTQPPTWQIKAVEILHDEDEKRIYYHDATFQVDGVPIAWTPYFSSYDPSVKRADGFLETLPGYKSQLGAFLRTSYYFDIAPDIDAVLEAGYYSHQGPLIGGQYRERFSAGQIELSGTLTESDLRQYPTPANQDEKTIRGNISGNGEFDLTDNWRAGFVFARSEDNLYVLKYGITSQQILTDHAYAEGFYDRGYINVSTYGFQDLRAGITQKQPLALPYVSYSFFGDPGETLGGRWADSGSLLDLQTFPGQNVQRLANNVSWSRKLFSDTGLVTVLNASAETDYYWTQNPSPDPVTNATTTKAAIGRFFPQAYAVMSYPVARQFEYAQVVIEPIASFVVAPAHANNQSIPNVDSQDIELSSANMFTGNTFPGTDRMDDGSRVTYGVRAGLYNLGTGSTSLFLGETYRISGDTIYPANSGLNSRFSDYVGELDINPGRLFDINYRFELSNDFKQNRLQEVNFRLGPESYGVYGTYLFAQGYSIPDPVITATQASIVVNCNTINIFASTNCTKNPERDEMSIAAYYKFDQNWSVTGSTTAELTQPKQVLRYGMSVAYTDDCSTFSLNISQDLTQPVGGTSGTAVFIQFSLKNLGIFRTPSVH